MKELLFVIIFVTALNGSAAQSAPKAKSGKSLAAQAEAVAGKPLPVTARSLTAFKEFTSAITVAELFQKVGAPDRDNGSGSRHIYIWELDDSSEIWAATADNKKFWYLDHVKNGMREKRFFGPSDAMVKPSKRVKS